MMASWLGNNPYMSYYEFYSGYGHYLSRQSATLQDYSVISTLTDLPVSLADVKAHLKLDAADTESDAYYTLLINAATLCAESAMRREIVNKQFRTYTNYLKDGMEIRRSKLITVDSLSYLDLNNQWQVIDPSAYYVTESNNYSKIYSDPNVGWPYVYSARQQSIKVEFTCGMGTPATNYCPPDVKLAIMHHIAVLHEQRGDWGSADLFMSQVIGCLPANSKLVYSQRRITNR